MTAWSCASPPPAMDSSKVKAQSTMGVFLNRIILASKGEQHTVFTVSKAVPMVVSYIWVHDLYDHATGTITADLALENAMQMHILHSCQIPDVLSLFTQVGWFECVGRMSMIIRRGDFMGIPLDVQRYFLSEGLAGLLVQANLMSLENSRKNHCLSTLQELVAGYMLPWVVK